ncbi:MAG: thrombospondin type 3 repeat-containing protein [bacterium]
MPNQQIDPSDYQDTNYEPVKKSKTGIILIVILVVLLAIGGGAWLWMKNSRPTDTKSESVVKDSDNDGLTDNDETKYGTNPNNSDSDNDGYLDGAEILNGYNPLGEGKLVMPQIQDTILCNIEGDDYILNIDTKELKKIETNFYDLSEYTGLPEETKNNQISISNSTYLLSEDHDKAIIVSITYDETKKPNNYIDSPPILKAEEFICDTRIKNCSPTTILDSAYKAVGKKDEWYNDYEEYYSFGDNKYIWSNWDSNKNILAGFYSIAVPAEWRFKFWPIYIYDANNDKIKQIGDFEDKNNKKDPIDVSFSPSLSKFAIINKNENKKWDLMLYSSDNLSTPQKNFDISSILSADGLSRINNWSEDEKTLVLSGHNNIYTLNLDNGQIDFRYTVTGNHYLQGEVYFSQRGRYIVFNDTSNDANKVSRILTAIDLQKDNTVLELFSDRDISLNPRLPD